ncbi:MAG: glycosyltransferase family 4 protein [Bacteroidia bacterium]
MSRKRILFVVNVDWFLVSHRLMLCQQCIEDGYEVYVSCRDTGRVNEIKDIGASFIDLPLDRSGTNVFQELSSLWFFIKLYKKVKPDVIHHITLKPVVYGSLAARMLSIPVVNAISGLGYNLSQEKQSFSKRIMLALMRIGFKNKSLTCIFQNKDDYEAMLNAKVISKRNRIEFIKGVGVDLNQYSFSEPLHKEKLEIILPARMLWDKGILEFKKAADILFEKYQNKIQFKLLGLADTDNKAGADQEVLNSWKIEGYFAWHSFEEDMIGAYRRSDIVVLPSYREGMPKSLIEACAVGRPIVTTTAIGCKECVDEGINGYKVEVRNHEQLASAIKALIDSEQDRKKMGAEGRKKAEREFDVKNVISRHMRIYSERIDG